jgi:hypothetical protein
VAKYANHSLLYHGAGATNMLQASQTRLANCRPACGLPRWPGRAGTIIAPRDDHQQ